MEFGSKKARRDMRTLTLLGGLVLVALVGGGVGQGLAEPTPAALPLPEEAAGTDRSGTEAAPDLPQSNKLEGFGYSINYPAGWSTATAGTVTAIAEQQADLDIALSPDSSRYSGATILFDHRSLSFMVDIGLGTNPTNEALLDLNIRIFGWTDITDRSEIELAGVTALSVRATSEFGQPIMAIQAVRPDDADIFLLLITVPSEEALLEVVPVWEAMLASIRQTELGQQAGPAGRFDVGGFELFLTCRGAGSPTILFEAPLGAGSGIWSGVLAAISERTVRRQVIWNR